MDSDKLFFNYSWKAPLLILTGSPKQKLIESHQEQNKIFWKATPNLTKLNKIAERHQQNF